MTKAQLLAGLVTRTDDGRLVWELVADERYEATLGPISLVLDGNRLAVERNGRMFRLQANAALLTAVQTQVGSDEVPDWLTL
jgi:hypothetical protein